MAAGVVTDFMTEDGGRADVVDGVAATDITPAHGSVFAGYAFDECRHHVRAVLLHAFGEQGADLAQAAGAGSGGNRVVTGDHLSSYQAQAHPLDQGLFQGTVDGGDLGQGIGFVVADVVDCYLGETGEHVDHGFALGVAVELQAALAAQGFQHLRRLDHVAFHVVDVARRLGVGVETDQLLLAVGLAANDRVGVRQQGDEAAVLTGHQGHFPGRAQRAGAAFELTGHDSEVFEAVIGLRHQVADAQADFLLQALGSRFDDCALLWVGGQCLEVDEVTADPAFTA